MPPPTGVGPPRAASDHLKLKLKFKDLDTERPTKLRVFETIFKKLNCQLTKLIPLDTGFIAITDNTKSRDTLCSARGLNELASINLEPTQSREQLAQRTLFLKQLDSEAGSHTPAEIKQELQSNHSWLTITEVHKIKNYTHIIKIVCTTTSMADQALEQGLILYYTKITPSQISKEKYIPLQTCFNCYKVNSHNTNDCPLTTPSCSICSATGHTHTQCKSTTKLCLNCPPPHNTHSSMYHGCPYRLKQQKLKEQTDIEKTREHTDTTYRNIVQATLKQTQPAKTPQIVLTNDIHLKLATTIIEAHVSSYFGHGNYSDILQENLLTNFGIEAKFPDRKSQNLFNMCLNFDQTSSNQPTAPQPKPQPQPQPQPQPPRKHRDPRRKHRDSTHSNPDNTEIETEWTTVIHRTHSENTSKRKHQTSPLEPESVSPDNFTIFRSADNLTSIPERLSNRWFWQEYQNGSLKVLITHDRWREIGEKLRVGAIEVKLEHKCLRILSENDYQRINDWSGQGITHQEKKSHK